MIRVRFESLKEGIFLAMLVCVSASIGMAQSQKSTAKTPEPKNDPPSNVESGVPLVSKSLISPNEYIIGASDILEIDVWKEKEISQELPVRPDGKISLPLIGEIQAAGLTPLGLQDLVTEKLKTYIESPQVTVIVKSPNSHDFNIVGEVARPGSYPLQQSMTVLDSIAAAGGFQTFAKKTKIYVLRPMPGGIRVRIPFNYKDVIMGRNLSQNIPLKPGDTIVVP
ncbi:MAG TPA: polysaccharide biosynthesis/export family protein [Candidatus Acidoferrales bacterium]|nr:polysaccharide biosynthesis/export family protein [Candidatus Acidoferrales bacterium]